jgi:hypothetical protein
LYLRHTRRYDADADFGDELNGNARIWIRAFKVVNELSEVLNAVDVVVGRRGDETHARNRMASLGDAIRHLTGEDRKNFVTFRQENFLSRH